jgi:hypothetical protein
MKIITEFYTETCEVRLTFAQKQNLASVTETAEGIEYALRRLISSKQQLEDLKHYADMYLNSEQATDKYQDACKKLIALQWENPFLLDDDILEFQKAILPF